MLPNFEWLLLLCTNIRAFFFGRMSPVRGTAASELGDYAFGLSLTVRCLKGHQAPVQATNVVLLAPIVRLTERRRLIGLVAQVSKNSSRSSRRAPDSEKALLRPVGRAHCAARL